MNARAITILSALAVFNLANGHSVSQDEVLKTPEDTKKIELYDGVTVQLPKGGNDTGRLFSIEIDTASEVEGRGKKKKLLQNVLPLFIMPFLIQSAIIPLFLSMLKFMLVKSLLIGKLALALIMINAFKNSNKAKGRNDEIIADSYYGYNGNGMEEMGTYFN